MKTWQKLSGPVALALVLIVMVVLGVREMAPAPEEPIARSYSCAVYTEQGCAKFVVASGGELEIQSGGTLDVQSGATVGLSSGTINGNLTITGTLDVHGDITLENDESISNSSDGVVQVGGFLALTRGSVVEVSYGSTITPTASFQPITSTVAITNAVIADGTVAGQIVILSNENAADDITILESGSNLAAGGDITLNGGDYDLVALVWDGSRWIRLAYSGN